MKKKDPKGKAKGKKMPPFMKGGKAAAMDKANEPMMEKGAKAGKKPDPKMAPKGKKKKGRTRNIGRA